MSREPSVARLVLDGLDETPSTGTCGVQDSVPFSVGDAVSAEHPRARDSGLSQEGSPSSAGISPGLVSGGDWSGTGPCPSAHGDSAEVRGPKGRGDTERRAERRLKETFPHVLSNVYWDGDGVWARGFFASTVGNQRGHNTTGRAASGRAGDGSSAA